MQTGNSSHKQKIYSWDSLLQGPSHVTEASILDRCSKIKDLNRRLAPFLEWDFLNTNDGLLITQKCLRSNDLMLVLPGKEVFCNAPKDCHLRKTPTIIVKQLATWINLAHSLGVVHGDIHPKNILILQDLCIRDQLIPVVIDWEPSLIQFDGFSLRKRVTEPWLDSQDARRNEISVRTDWLCFHHLVTRKSEAFYRGESWSEIAQWLTDDVFKNKAHALCERFLLKMEPCASSLG